MDWFLNMDPSRGRKEGARRSQFIQPSAITLFLRVHVFAQSTLHVSFLKTPVTIHTLNE